MSSEGKKVRRVQWLHGSNTNFSTRPTQIINLLRPSAYLKCNGIDSMKITLQSALHIKAVKVIYLTHYKKILSLFLFLKDA